MRNPSDSSLKLMQRIVPLSLMLASCATASEAPASEEERGTPNEIVRAEILRIAADAPNAYQVIRRLRSTWLQPRGLLSLANPNPAEPVVYLDQVRWGSPDSLYQISSDQIMRMQFIGATDAMTLWGTGHPGGVISIETVPE